MLQVDQILENRYRIVKVMGRGGMGAVYEARHLTLDMVCVVKEMLPPDDAELVDALAKQFAREAKILAGLRHPNLPRVSDYFTENGYYYIVMDLINGQSLDKLIGPQGLPEKTVRLYADQLLDVLDYLHGQGVLHRDIKPANIIVQPDGHVVLVDFGLVKEVGSKTANYSMRLLTPHFAPPEQYSGGTDARSDLYSLAATLYQSLSAQLPTSAADQFAGQKTVSLHQLRPDVSMNTVRVIEKGLQLDRAKRYQSAAEMRAALNGTATKNATQKATPVKSAAAAADANPTLLFDNQHPPSAATRLTGAPEKPAVPRWELAAIGVLAVVVIALVVFVIVPGLAQQPAAPPTPLPTPAPASAVVEITNTAAPRQTVTPAPTDTSAPVATNIAAAATPVPEATNTLQPTSTATATASNSVILTLMPGVTMEMIRVPAGEFLMGSSISDTALYTDELPQHSVTLDEYLIARYDVTNAQFRAFVQATGYKTTAEQQGSGLAYNGTNFLDTKGADWQHPRGPNSNIDGQDNYPVVLVSWDDAVAFCKWASQVTGRKVQLPSEAQWEKAARGPSTGSGSTGSGSTDSGTAGDGRLFPWGNSEPTSSQLNFNNNVKDITPVGKYSPAGDSPYGVADMAGNVWQWTNSLYKPYPYSANDGREDLSSRDLRVLRGGGFGNGRRGVRSAIRNKLTPDYHSGVLGFRVVAPSA
jgi:formylglycine-generating enzyme required for sulfatase activity/tRNA A-37 threonylcarbamoyl transferase component Bud32